MNNARRLYLSTYGRIDIIDHLIINAYVWYRTWKYWHALNNHAIALATVTVYDIYRECCELPIEKGWLVSSKDQLDFFSFREKLSSQMLNYSPKKLLYPSDEKMRMVTVMLKSDRAKRQPPTDTISLSQFRAAKRTVNSRLCSDLDKLCYHVKSIQQLNKPRIRAWCGLQAYSACGKCAGRNFKPIPLHYNAKRAKEKIQYASINTIMITALVWGEITRLKI